MKNQRNDLKFYPAVAKKNHYEVEVNYIQFGIIKRTTKYSVCKGKKLLGIEAWTIKNPTYVTQEVWEKRICKVESDRLEYITETKYIWDETGA